jgi:hypothetical protein
VNDRRRLELLRRAVDHLERTEIGYVEYDETGRGSEWRAAMRALSRLEHDLLPDPLPALGPIWSGGRSLLVQDLTHETDGIPLYPAFDDAFAVGRAIVAPEPLTVISPATSSSPGAAFYARGTSKLRYWFAHLDHAPRIGTRFVKGQTMAHVCPQFRPNGAANHHCHCGVNVELLLGPGHELEHHSNYTHGARTIGAQLREILQG